MPSNRFKSSWAEDFTPKNLEQAPPWIFTMQAQKAGAEDIAGCRYKHGNLKRMTDCLCLSAESRLIEVPAYLCVILSFFGVGFEEKLCPRGFEPPTLRSAI